MACGIVKCILSNALGFLSCDNLQTLNNSYVRGGVDVKINISDITIHNSSECTKERMAGG